jgi:hypothetical protein
VPLSQRAQDLLAESIRSIPDGKHGALIGFVDLDGSVHTAVAARIGDGWEVAARFEMDPATRKPRGGVAIQKSW